MQLVQRLGALKRLVVGVDRDEIHAGQAAFDHPVEGVAAASAHANDLDLSLQVFTIEIGYHPRLLRLRPGLGVFRCRLLLRHRLRVRFRVGLRSRLRFWCRIGLHQVNYLHRLLVVEGRQLWRRFSGVLRHFIRLFGLRFQVSWFRPLRCGFVGVVEQAPLHLEGI